MLQAGRYPSDFKTKRKQSDSCGSYQNNTEGFRSHGTYNSNVYNNTGNFKPYVNYASVDKQKEESEFTKKEYNQMKNLLHNKEQSDCKANLKGNTSLQTKSSAYDWIIDSRATHHVASYEELMYELKNTRNEHPSTIQLPTGSKAQVKHTGNSVIFGNQTVKNVLHVPDFKFNLLSVAKLTKELSCSVSFFPYFCVLQELYSGKVIGIGKEVDGLYLLQGTIRARVNSASTSIKDANLTDLWHFRLGHPPIEVMKQIPSLKKYFNITTYSCCHICPVAKQSRLSFPTSNSKSTHIFLASSY